MLPGEPLNRRTKKRSVISSSRTTMKRLMNILCCASLLLLATAVAAWYLRTRGFHEFPLGQDLNRALSVLHDIQLGEARCFKATGHYVPLQDLGLSGCGRLQNSIPAGADDNFRVEVRSSGDRYSATIHPLSTARLHSLYLDEAGRVHFGTRDWPATANSPLLVPEKHLP
jgi:hypothetical protein